MSKKLLKWFNVLLGISLIAYLITKFDFQKLPEILGELHLGLALVSLLLFAVFLLMQAYRWYYLLSDYKISYWGIVRIFLIGIFLNNFLPGGIGGDGYKVYYLNKIEKGLGKAATLTILDRIAGMLVMLGILLAFVLVRWQEVTTILNFNLATNYWVKLGIVAGGLLVGLLVFFLFLYSPFAKKLKDFIQQCREALNKVSLRQMLSLAAQALAAHCVKGVSYLLLLYSLGSSCDYFALLFALAVIGWLVVLPISIGGLGVREGALVVLLQNFGVALPFALAFSLTSRLMIYLAALIGGLLFLTRNKVE